MINWQALVDIAQLDQIAADSHTRIQIIFKHSTRCSISSMALARLERGEPLPDANYYLLDLLAHRPISNTIAEQFSVYHESPQVLVIKDGECIGDESHIGISVEAIVSMASQ
jgi:bacillithiol system protein YtxJ